MEDNLDCPLVELDLVTKIGERKITDSNRRESIYAFRLEEKAEITAELFVFCLDDFWQKHHQTETSLTLRDVTVGTGSPGRIFKFPDHVVRQRLEELERDEHSHFGFQESAAVQRVIRRGAASPKQLLAAIYR